MNFGLVEDNINVVVTFSSSAVVLAVAPPSLDLKACAPPTAVIPLAGIQGPPGPQGIPGTGSTSNYVFKDGSYYAQFGDDFIGVNSSNGNVTITLPISTSENLGQQIEVSKLDSSDYVVNVVTQEGQLIDQISTVFIIDGWNEVDGFFSLGTGWKAF